MPQYLVKNRIKKDKLVYVPGSVIELTEAEASEIPWAVEAIAEPKKAEAAKESKKAKKAEAAKESKKAKKAEAAKE